MNEHEKIPEQGNDENQNFTFNSDVLDENTSKPVNFDEHIQEIVPEPTRHEIFRPIAPNSKIVSIVHLKNLKIRANNLHKSRKLHKKMAKLSRKKNRK